MLRIEPQALASDDDLRTALQNAIALEHSTIPPYLTAMLTLSGTSDSVEYARNEITEVIFEEMMHMTLACNILNAIGGDPVLTPPTYPGPLPGHIGPDGEPLVVSLLPFSKAAMQQGMNIEQPETKPNFPVARELVEAAAPAAVTIGQFYDALDAFLATLSPRAWKGNRNQITDLQFLTGQLFAVNGYPDAHRAISVIVSEGEGTGDNPLDFADEVAHYFRFGEIFHDKVLTKIPEDPGWQWGPKKLGVDWTQVFPAIPDPQTHDFSVDPPAAQAAQAACNTAYSQMVDALRRAVTGQPAQLGVAVRAMFDLRMATQVALRTPLADGTSVSGPAFVYVPNTPGATP